MNVRGFGQLGGCASTPESQAIAEVLALLRKIACRESCNLSMTSECLTVTVGGAWGEIGDIVQALRWFDPCQIPPTSFITVWVNTNTNAIVTGIDNTNTEPCSSGGGGGSGVGLFEYFICDDGNPKIVQVCGTSCGTLDVTYLDLDRTPTTEPVDWDNVTAGACPDFVSNATVGVARVTATGAGSVTGGALGVSITNVGSANGVVLGEPIYPSQSINLGAIYNNFNNNFYFLPAIDYDGTGTTLSITVMSY